MQAARQHAVDLILREVIGDGPWPLNNGVILIDEPAEERVGVRYFADGKVYHNSCSRLVFEQRDDGSVYVTPCAPRRAPAPAPPGVWITVPTSHLTYDWIIAGDPPPPRRRWGPPR